MSIFILSNVSFPSRAQQKWAYMSLINLLPSEASHRLWHSLIKSMFFQPAVIIYDHHAAGCHSNTKCVRCKRGILNGKHTNFHLLEKNDLLTGAPKHGLAIGLFSGVYQRMCWVQSENNMPVFYL